MQYELKYEKCVSCGQQRVVIVMPHRGKGNECLDCLVDGSYDNIDDLKLELHEV